MTTAQESKKGSSIFIGRWTPKILFPSKRGLIVTVSCAAIWEVFHSVCLPERCATSKPPD